MNKNFISKHPVLGTCMQLLGKYMRLLGKLAAAGQACGSWAKQAAVGKPAATSVEKPWLWTVAVGKDAFGHRLL